MVLKTILDFVAILEIYCDDPYINEFFDLENLLWDYYMTSWQGLM